MLVRTNNSTYQVIGKGDRVEIEKIEGNGRGQIADGAVLTGTRLVLAIGQPMVLTGGTGPGVHTSPVVSIRG